MTRAEAETYLRSRHRIVSRLYPERMQSIGINLYIARNLAGAMALDCGTAIADLGTIGAL